jgi:regulator of protease activity HflC (stomatin/prohibitin superfamily)
MTAGLGIDRLIDLLIDTFWWFVPFYVIRHYERGVVLRFGKFSREVGPGFHWMWPLGMEEVINENIKPDGFYSGPISCTLKDGTFITLSYAIVWEIKDVTKLLLEVEDKETIYASMSGYVQEWFSKRSLEDISKIRQWSAESGKRHGIREQLTKFVNAELTDWTGVVVDDILLRDFVVTSLKDGLIRTFTVE